MAVEDGKAATAKAEGKAWGFCRFPFFGSGAGTGGGSASSSTTNSSTALSLTHRHHPRSSERSQLGQREGGAAERRSSGAGSVSSVARSLLPTRRRLRLDPSTKLYFPYEPGKQARSAVRIKNTSKAHVAFKFQTTAPKSCFMRPPGGILSPGESIIATVFKFVEQPENNEKPMEQKCNVKFKIISLKVNGPTEYIPELFDEQKDQVAVEQILQVVFLDPERSCSQMDKLKRQLAEAEAAIEARKKPPEDSGPRIIGEGLVIDEWKERRERYLAQQQVGGVDSV
ncbi:vesicle-associated protein 4-2-like [Zingiber officinale]|uniref:vesicle-associated protein 4-2-like n=1 Tax=Zingiber officinale TaxID=94328 RepID=UPI001C4A80B8|nr:vesicle-associated protein 4-2-like [Zingiber officinale]XP_042428382.1 vesicle-associated protein 4-2-like isoform X1 [Zingiber officinale]XP_042428385.1 vesicle-associated protein 4-2-like isoform X2 [Zingiber officinale]XP_042453244.1 vesicle-associated protein 4-2-like [Zingiber officinale]